MGLNTGTEHGGVAEIAGQAQGRVGTDAGSLVADLADPDGRDADV